MGWTVETFAGTRATGQPSNWAVAMSELCRAVNERRALAGSDLTTFYLPDYHPSTNPSAVSFYPTAEQLKGRFSGDNTAFGVDGSFVRRNLAQISQGIKTLLRREASVGVPDFLGRFTVASGRSALYTPDSMETAIGYPLWSDPDLRNALSADYWQALKDALDLMIHLWRRPGLDSASSDYYAAVNRRGASVYTGWSDAWSGGLTTASSDYPPNPRTVTQTTPVPNFQEGGWSVLHDRAVVSSNALTRMYTRIAYTFDPGNLAGDLQEVWFEKSPEDAARFRYRNYWRFDDSFPEEAVFRGPLDITVTTAGETFSFTGGTTLENEDTATGSGTTDYAPRQLANEDFPLGETAVLEVEIDNTPPTGSDWETECPWDEASKANYCCAGFWFDVVYYVDIAGELTDQK